MVKAKQISLISKKQHDNTRSGKSEATRKYPTRNKDYYAKSSESKVNGNLNQCFKDFFERPLIFPL